VEQQGRGGFAASHRGAFLPVRPGWGVSPLFLALLYASRACWAHAARLGLNSLCPRFGSKAAPDSAPEKGLKKDESPTQCKTRIIRTWGLAGGDVTGVGFIPITASSGHNSKQVGGSIVLGSGQGKGFLELDMIGNVRYHRTPVGCGNIMGIGTHHAGTGITALCNGRFLLSLQCKVAVKGGKVGVEDLQRLEKKAEEWMATQAGLNATSIESWLSSRGVNASDMEMYIAQTALWLMEVSKNQGARPSPRIPPPRTREPSPAPARRDGRGAQERTLRRSTTCKTPPSPGQSTPPLCPSVPPTRFPTALSLSLPFMPRWLFVAPSARARGEGRASGGGTEGRRVGRGGSECTVGTRVGATVGRGGGGVGSPSTRALSDPLEAAYRARPAGSRNPAPRRSPAGCAPLRHPAQAAHACPAARPRPDWYRPVAS